MRWLYFFLGLLLPLWSAEFSLQLSKTKAFVNEPMTALLTFKYEPKDRVKKVELRDIELRDFLVQEVQKIENRGKIEYVFLFIPLKNGDLLLKRLSIKALIEDKKTGLKEWKFFYTKAQKITVLEAPLDIVGSLTMQSSLKKEKNIIKYTITLEGLANFEQIKPFKLPINSYYYSTKPQISYEYNDSKVTGRFKQHFSIISNEDITIAPILFRYFNSNTKMIETLQTKPFSVTFRKEFNFLYLLSFILGALFMLLVVLFMRRDKSNTALIKRIARARNTKELYEIVIKNAHKYDFSQEIKELESILYQHKRAKVKKRDIIKKIKNCQKE